MKKLSFKTHLLTMIRETLLSAILSRKYQMTLSTQQDTSSASILSELEEREEIAEDIPAPTPAPADTLETVERQPYTPGSRKSTKKNFGRPASAYSDSYMQTLSRPGLVDDQYKVELSDVFKSRRH